MEPVHPAFVPDASDSREAMERLQDDIAETAVFDDEFAFDPARVWPTSESGQQRLDEAGTAATDTAHGESPVVVGVDQAFVDDGERAVSALVAFRDGEVIERAHAVAPTDIPYIPGLLSFREGGAILAGFRELSVEPDLAVFDGSGRIHFRQAGLATHVGVTLDLPSLGVAKSLLCGDPQGSTEGLDEGECVPIEANSDVTAPDGTVIGHAVQSRQFSSGNRHINPLIVSPGHRLSAETAVEFVLACAQGYKLPEPTRQADAYADELKGELA
jgi:deoxyribonuclease V